MATEKIVNPILTGFNPDPSICRAGDDYYIATSTFEWYPGVQIHHSTDLKNWRLAARPLNRPELLNMLGTPDSCGVWAPCLTWSGGLFYLVYTDVKRFDGNFKDTHNYLTTSATIDGEWSDPAYLNSSGFDPSLFHDDDGRKWLLNMVWDHRAPRRFFRGIALQEYSVDERRLVGERKIIFEGTDLECTEGPHLYRRNGYYYLITAEGGTSYGHAITMARSRSISGPYEVDPSGPVVTSRDNPEWPLQRAGHGDIVETESGELFLVHLVSRPLPGTRLSPLGRETAIEKLEYTDDAWFRIAGGYTLPQPEWDAPAPAGEAVPAEIRNDNFDVDELNPVYQWLRTPWPKEFLSLTDRPGFLRLYGMESPGSLFRQALIARRQTSFAYEAATVVDFEPDNFQQMAGLVLYYNSSKFHYLYVSACSDIGRHIGIMSCQADPSLNVEYPIEEGRIALPDSTPVHLRAEVDGAQLNFFWSLNDSDWHRIPAVLDAGILSDEAGKGSGASFTGAFVGVCCNDLTGTRKHADFDYLRYAPRAPAPSYAE
jgi:xylan 1,4-beta-xylosidase